MLDTALRPVLYFCGSEKANRPQGLSLGGDMKERTLVVQKPCKCGNVRLRRLADVPKQAYYRPCRQCGSRWIVKVTLFQVILTDTLIEKLEWYDGERYEEQVLREYGVSATQALQARAK